MTPRRVLVVDDNVDYAATEAFLLTFAGHQVRVATDGRSAIEAAVCFRPEVILLDLGLPSMDGYAVARVLRSDPTLKGMTLIAMTGYGDAQSRRRSLEAGFDQHLLKPVDHKRVEALLRGLPGEQAPSPEG